MFPSKFLAKKTRGLTPYWSIYPFHVHLWRLDTRPPWEVKGLTQEFHKRSALPANVPRTPEVEVEVENAWLNIQSIHVWSMYLHWRFGKCLEFITSWLGSTLIPWSLAPLMCSHAHLSGASPVAGSQGHCNNRFLASGNASNDSVVRGHVGLTKGLQVFQDTWPMIWRLDHLPKTWLEWNDHRVKPFGKI